MTPEEQFFLARVAPIDWRATRWELADQFGVTRYHAWADVVTLPPSFCGLPFSMYAKPADLPPEYLFADFVAHDDARANHAEMEARLVAALGPATVADTANCLRRTWSFGVFGAALHTFPPELQDPRSGRNTLIANEPRLALSASVSLSSAYAWVYPDESLAGVGENTIQIKGRPVWGRGDTRRNPASLRVRGLVAWRDGERVGISDARDSLGLARSGCLVLVHVRAGRSAAQSFAEFHGNIVLADAGENELDEEAPRIARLWGVPLEERTVAGDG